MSVKTADADILIVPGFRNSGPDHWQSRWQARLKTARRVEQSDWNRPVARDWMLAVSNAIPPSGKPVIIVAHGLGVAATVLAVSMFPENRVKGAFFVSVPDVEDPGRMPFEEAGFAPIPRDPLPFPSALIASRNDPFCDYDKAEDLAYAWGSLIIDAGNAGHIDGQSGHGPWPEGLMRFGAFLTRLNG